MSPRPCVPQNGGTTASARGDRCTVSESIVHSAAWHDALIPSASVGRRAWRQGQAIPIWETPLSSPGFAPLCVVSAPSPVLSLWQMALRRGDARSVGASRSRRCSPHIGMYASSCETIPLHLDALSLAQVIMLRMFKAFSSQPRHSGLRRWTEGVAGGRERVMNVVRRHSADLSARAYVCSSWSEAYIHQSVRIHRARLGRSRWDCCGAHRGVIVCLSGFVWGSRPSFKFYLAIVPNLWH